MRKSQHILFSLLAVLLFSSCAEDFHQRKYTKYRGGRYEIEIAGSKENLSPQAKSAIPDFGFRISDSGDSANGTRLRLPDGGTISERREARVGAESKIAVSMENLPSEAKSVNPDSEFRISDSGNFANGTRLRLFSGIPISEWDQGTSTKSHSPKKDSTPEDKVRRKGWFSIGIGLLAMLIFTMAVILMSAGNLLYILPVVLAGLTGFVGVRVAVSAKRDLDQLSARSTKKKLNRPSTVGFIMNVVVLAASGLILLFLLIGMF